MAATRRPLDPYAIAATLTPDPEQQKRIASALLHFGLDLLNRTQIIRPCANCGEPVFIGPKALGGRRSDTDFCSTSCRVAASQDRKTV